MNEPCRCPLCRNLMRNLPRGSRTWHCDQCGETMTEGYLSAWPATPMLPSLMVRMLQAESVDGGEHAVR